MNVQIIRNNGGPEVFEPTTMERPRPEAGQVLVRIAACSVNTADLMARSMGPVIDFIPSPQAVLGMDFAATAPIVDSVFPLAQAADAHRKLENGSTVGKVVVLVSA